MCTGAVIDIAPGITLLFGGVRSEAFASRIEHIQLPPLFPHGLGWIEATHSQGWDGGRCNAQQRHQRAQVAGQGPLKRVSMKREEV
jgi:hypothetical protein